MGSGWSTGEVGGFDWARTMVRGFWVWSYGGGQLGIDCLMRITMSRVWVLMMELFKTLDI